MVITLNMSTGLAPIVHLGTTGTYLSAAGDIYRVLLTGAQTGGRFLLAEVLVKPGGGPPLHRHRHEDETFYVLEGELTVELGERRFVAGCNSTVFAPRDVPHRFTNATGKRVRVLVLAAPAGVEAFFAEFSEPLADREADPRPLGPADVAHLLAVAPKFGIEILAPTGTGVQGLRTV